MKQTPLKRGKPMGRSQPKRDWQEARAKVDREGMCRVLRPRDSMANVLRWDPYGLCEGKLEAAHVVGREHDRYDETVTGEPPKRWIVRPVRVVPLCRKHHRAYDAHELDLLPYLTVEEQAQAVLDAGGIELARRRICGAYPQGDGS